MLQVGHINKSDANKKFVYARELVPRVKCSFNLQLLLTTVISYLCFSEETAIIYFTSYVHRDEHKLLSFADRSLAFTV